MAMTFLRIVVRLAAVGSLFLPVVYLISPDLAAWKALAVSVSIAAAVYEATRLGSASQAG